MHRVRIGLFGQFKTHFFRQSFSSIKFIRSVNRPHRDVRTHRNRLHQMFVSPLFIVELTIAQNMLKVQHIGAPGVRFIGLNRDLNGSARDFLGGVHVGQAESDGGFIE